MTTKMTHRLRFVLLLVLTTLSATNVLADSTTCTQLANGTLELKALGFAGSTSKQQHFIIATKNTTSNDLVLFELPSRQFHKKRDENDFYIQLPHDYQPKQFSYFWSGNYSAGRAILVDFSDNKTLFAVYYVYEEIYFCIDLLESSAEGNEIKTVRGPICEASFHRITTAASIKDHHGSSFIFETPQLSSSNTFLAVFAGWLNYSKADKAFKLISNEQSMIFGPFEAPLLAGFSLGPTLPLYLITKNLIYEFTNETSHSNVTLPWSTFIQCGPRPSNLETWIILSMVIIAGSGLLFCGANYWLKRRRRGEGTFDGKQKRNNSLAVEFSSVRPKVVDS